VDTGSSWVWTNCPRALYWDGDPAEAHRPADARKITPNKDYRLAKIVQASAAAPFYFDMVPLEVERGQGGVFFDGAMTPHGNPALQMAMTALIPAYGLGWAAGAENLLLVSVGTGWPKPVKPDWSRRPRLLALWKALHAITSMSYDTSQLALSTLQWLGTSPQPWWINSELKDMRDASPGIDPLWTFLRYDAPLESKWLSENLDRHPAPRVLHALGRLDDDRQVPALHELGLAAGERLIRTDHFPAAFDP